MKAGSKRIPYVHKSKRITKEQEKQAKKEFYTICATEFLKWTFLRK